MLKKRRHIEWNSRYKGWKTKPPKKIRKNVLFPCPKCDDLNNKARNKFFKNPNRKTTNWDVIINFDKREVRLTNWACARCGLKLDYEKFPDITKNFLTNLVMRDLGEVYFNPKLLILKLKSGKEVSGKALEAEAKIKLEEKSIDLICGNCNKKNKFGDIKSEQPNVIQCLKCGHVNIYKSDLNVLDMIRKGN